MLRSFRAGRVGHSYRRFETPLDEDAIEAVTVHGDRIEGRYRVEQDSGATRFVTVRVPPDVVGRLKAADVDFEGARPNTLLVTFLSWILPALLLLGLWIHLFRGIAGRQGMGGMMAVGESRAKVCVERDTGRTFAAVAGVDQAKAELEEILHPALLRVHSKKVNVYPALLGAAGAGVGQPAGEHASLSTA
jgi:cell division protease FtsH